MSYFSEHVACRAATGFSLIQQRHKQLENERVCFTSQSLKECFTALQSVNQGRLGSLSHPSCTLEDGVCIYYEDPLSLQRMLGICSCRLSLVVTVGASKK